MQSKAAHMCVLAVGSYRTSATISFLHKGHWNLRESMSGIVSGSKMNKIGKQIFYIVFFSKKLFWELKANSFSVHAWLTWFFSVFVLKVIFTAWLIRVSFNGLAGSDQCVSSWSKSDSWKLSNCTKKLKQKFCKILHVSLFSICNRKYPSAQLHKLFR